MPSDDESSCFDVHSISSDTESQANWDSSAETMDQYDFEPGLFRMPAPSVGFAARCVPVPRDTLQAVDLPARKSNNDRKGIEFIIFATIGAAKTISAQLQKIGDSDRISTSYYDGNGVCRLSGKLSATPTTRVGILYFSTVDSHDPLAEYKLFVAKEGPLRCTPVTDCYLDPFCLSSASIIFTDKSTLAEATVDKRNVFLPVPLTLFANLSADTLVPQVGELKRLGDLNNKTSGMKQWPILIASILSATMLLLNLYNSFNPISGGALIAPNAAFRHAPDVSGAYSVFAEQSMQRQPSVYVHLTPSERADWLKLYSCLNYITGSFCSVLDTTLDSLSSLMTATLLWVENALNKLSTSASSGCSSTKTYTVNSYNRATSGIKNTWSGLANGTASLWHSGLQSSEGFYTRWLQQASKDYHLISKKQFSKFFDHLRGSRGKPKAANDKAPTIGDESPYSAGRLWGFFNLN